MQSMRDVMGDESARQQLLMQLSNAMSDRRVKKNLGKGELANQRRAMAFGLAGDILGADKDSIAGGIASWPGTMVGNVLEGGEMESAVAKGMGNKAVENPNMLLDSSLENTPGIFSEGNAVENPNMLLDSSLENTPGIFSEGNAIDLNQGIVPPSMSMRNQWLYNWMNNRYGGTQIS